MSETLQLLKSDAQIDLQTGYTPEEIQEPDFIFDFDDLWIMQNEVQKFLVPELLPSGAVAVLIGDDGIGKTQMLTQLALSVGLGYNTFLGQPLNTKNNSSLVVATEDSVQKFARSMSKQIKNLTVGFDPAKHKKPAIKFMEGSNYDDWKTFCDRIEKQLIEFEHDLVIIDALSDLFGFLDGDINDNSIARKILQKLQVLAQNHECTVVLIHHVAKTKILSKHREGKIFVEKSDSQGAGAITQKPRTILALSNDKGSLSEDGRSYCNYLHVVKANLMGKHFVQFAIKAVFDTWALLHKYDGEVDIQLFENPDAQPATGGSQPEPEHREETRSGKRLRPEELSDEHHQSKLNEVFENYDELLDRGKIIERMQYAYGIGKTKVEQKGGYLAYLIDKKMVLKYGPNYKRLQWEQTTAYKEPELDFNPPPGFILKPSKLFETDFEEPPF